MKKPIYKEWYFWVIIVLLVIILFLFNDNGSNNNGSNNNGVTTTTTTTTTTKKTCNHSYSNATCTEPQKCTKCGETKGTALGHTTSTGICSRCNTNFGEWEIRYYVDEFNRPTDEMYITNKDWIIGTFSNSATNNSLLKAKILIDNLDGPRVSIILYEYGSNQVKAYYEQNYNITLLDTNNTKHNLRGIMYDGGDRVRLYVSYGGYDYISMMINALLQPGEISLYMVESKYTVNEYLFSVKTSNFAELYAELTGGNSNNTGNNNNNSNSTKLDFTLSEDGQSYCVSGIGTYDSSNLVIPEQYNGKPVTEIGKWAFADNEVITSVTIPDTITTIHNGAFNGCFSLENVTLGNGLSSISATAFANCTSLTSINVPENHPKYKSIDGILYTKDGSILIAYPAGKTDSSFVVPNSVTEIGDAAFWGCIYLEKITIGNGIVNVNGDPFYNCLFLTNIDVSQNNQYYKSINGNLYTKDGKTLLRYAIGKTDTSFSIPNGVTRIEDWAFEKARCLENVKIPNTVSSIGYYSFSSCSSLVSVTIPNSVTSMDEGAFDGCGYLTSIYFEGTKVEWESIDKYEDEWGFAWDSYTENYVVYCTDGNISK